MPQQSGRCKPEATETMVAGLGLLLTPGPASPCEALREYDKYMKATLFFAIGKDAAQAFGAQCVRSGGLDQQFASTPNACLGLVAAARSCACRHGQADAHRPRFAKTLASLDPKQCPRITRVMGDLFRRGAPPEQPAHQAARIRALMLHHVKARAIAAMLLDYCELLRPMDDTRTRARMPGQQ
jgi:hypothetical protein